MKKSLDRTIGQFIVDGLDMDESIKILLVCITDLTELREIEEANRRKLIQPLSKWSMEESCTRSRRLLVVPGVATSVLIHEIRNKGHFGVRKMRNEFFMRYLVDYFNKRAQRCIKRCIRSLVVEIAADLTKEEFTRFYEDGSSSESDDGRVGFDDPQGGEYDRETETAAYGTG